MIEDKNNPKYNIIEILQVPAPQPLNLIAHGWEKVAYLGAFLVLTLIILITGYLSKRIEHTLVLAFMLSLILIALLT
ncbi:hypothetical protein [Phormidesmis priestleyi]|uniref:hypothetical protein n=1 Tax=Phormidesmis priestleyi TaxID=268141 RepID=UPI00083A6E7B|nr:hypothetical protein [Phormidesmis priestleyi]